MQAAARPWPDLLLFSVKAPLCFSCAFHPTFPSVSLSYGPVAIYASYLTQWV